MAEKLHLDWDDIEFAVNQLVDRHQGAVDAGEIEDVYGIPQGGAVPAVMVAQVLSLPIVSKPTAGTLIVDDLVDSGATAIREINKHQPGQNWHFDALYRKKHSPGEYAPNALMVESDQWIVFPWERDEGEPTDNVVRMLEFIGEDPTREGLLETPKRFLKAFQEMTQGYHLDPEQILSKSFPGEDYDEMIVVSGVPFNSMCEHHLLPFSGTATVAYIPGPEGRVVGLSKIPRLIHCFAQRLQIQEGLTVQVADALTENLNPLGVGVILTSHHSCMSLRGIKSHGQMTTSKLTGAFRDDPAARAELLSLHNGGS